MTTTSIHANLINASNAAEAAFQANDYPLMVAAYVQLKAVAAAAYDNGLILLGDEATEMANDLTYCW